MFSWYAIHTKPRSEEIAEENLVRQGFETYLPRCVVSRRNRGKWVDRIEPLFPRYLFIRLDLERDNVAPIRSTRGVVGLVRFSNTPAPVPEGLVEKLKASANPETGLHALNAGGLEKGDKVRISEGPLSELDAVFLAWKGSDRALVLLSLLGKQNLVTVKKDKVIKAA